MVVTVACVEQNAGLRISLRPFLGTHQGEPREKAKQSLAVDSIWFSWTSLCAGDRVAGALLRVLSCAHNIMA